MFLFDFNGDLYGKTLDVAFIAFIRDEVKFDGIEALVRQMDEHAKFAPFERSVAWSAMPRRCSLPAKSAW